MSAICRIWDLGGVAFPAWRADGRRPHGRQFNKIYNFSKLFSAIRFGFEKCPQTQTIQLDVDVVSPRSRPLSFKAMQRSDCKQLVSALAAGIGVTEFGFVIPEFQPRPRPLPEECASSSSPESDGDQFDDSARLNLCAIEDDRPNFVDLTFSKLRVDDQLYSVLPSIGDRSTVLTSSTVATHNLSSV